MSQSNPKISIIIVTWNNEATIKYCLESIISPQYEIECEIILIDNNSTDNTLTEIQSYPISKIICNEINQGFCAANNNGVRLASGKFVLFLNPDAAIAPGYIGIASNIMDSNPRYAQLAGKLQRMNLEGEPILVDGKPVIDSAGIELLRNRQAVDIGSGDPDHGQFDEERKVFGVSGAVCFCRRKALLDAMVNGQVFDETFFAYKEDVDLSWRLNKLGWESLYSPSLLAFHARGWKYRFQERENIPKTVRYHSFKNRRLMILKNETLNSFLPDIFPIFWFEIRAFIYILFKEPFLIKSYWRIFQEIPHILRWRRSINRKIQSTARSAAG